MGIKTYQYILGSNLILDVEVNETPYVPAVIHAPVEQCHEAEGGEVEIQGVTVNGEEFDIDELYIYDSHMSARLGCAKYESLESVIVTAILEGSCNG